MFSRDTFERPLAFLVIALIFAFFSTPLSPRNFAGVSPATHHVLLLTAHPDDECMFFGPTIIDLVRQPSYELYSLCLSSGDAYGIGELRKGELTESLDVLGVAKNSRWVLDGPFKDNITQLWETGEIVEQVEPFILKYNIDIILTFDERGVSSHPNHIALSQGASALVAEHKYLRGFSLVSTNVLPKYMGPFAAVWTTVQLRFCILLNEYYSTESCLSKDAMTFLSGKDEYLLATKAMLRHKSQMVWFRWLYIAFSRYMWVNEWVEIQ